MDLSGPLPEDPLEPFYDYSGLTTNKKSSHTPQVDLDGEGGEEQPAREGDEQGGDAQPEEAVLEDIPEEDEGPVEELLGDVDEELPAV